MDEPRIVVRPPRQKRARHPLEPQPTFGWVLLGAIGVVFVVVGGMDLLLTWYPWRLGNAEWEFGTVSATLNNLPLATMGLAFILASGMATGKRQVVRWVAIGLVVIGVLILAAGVLYLTDVPIALRSVAAGPIRTGLKKAVTKTLAQSVFYPLGFGWIAWQAWRRTTPGKGQEDV